MMKLEESVVTNIHFERVNDTIFLRFTLNGEIGLYMHVKKKKGKWRPKKLFHDSKNNEKGKLCPYCRSYLSIGYICSTHSKDEKVKRLYNEIMQRPEARIRALLVGITDGER